MNILIIYMSSHGCAKSVARKMVEKLNNHEVTLHNLKDRMLPHLNKYDVIIIGGSIHVSSIQSKIKSYCKKNESLLLEKKLGLYICCMEVAEIAQKQFKDAFPESLRKAAVAKALVGGEFNFDKMNFFEKAIVRSVAKVNESVSNIKDEAIDEFVKKINYSIN